MKTYSICGRGAPILVLSALLAVGGLPGRAEAGLLIKALGAQAAAGGTGTFDVVLVNDTNQSYDVSTFSIGLSVASGSGITFSEVTTATAAAYIFAGIGGADFDPGNFEFAVIDPAGTSFKALDSAWLDPYYFTLGAGETIGLAHVTFAVGSGAKPGVVSVSLLDIGGATELSNVNGESLDFDPVAGSITITGGVAVPEPSSLALLTVAGVSLLGLRRWRRRAE